MEKWLYKKSWIDFFRMKIVTLMPIFNPQASFFATILPLVRRQSVHSEIIVIDSGTINVSAEHIHIRKIQQSEFNHANTRNLALNYEADFYLFMTQDAMPYDERLIAKLLKAFEDEEVVVSYARQIPYKDADAIEVFARTTNYPAHSVIKSKEDLPHLGIKTFFCSDSCAMYRASYFKEVGGFKQGLNTNEDMEYAARAIMDGKKVAYMAEAKVYHSHTFTCKNIWNRYLAIGQFFKENSWILDVVNTYSKAESTGIKQAYNELKYLWKHSRLDIPRSIVCSLVKYIAFKFRF